MDSISRIWQPLDTTKLEIRLFVLAPSATRDAPPDGSLINFSLEESLDYEAISHAWGRPAGQRVIYVNGIEWLVSVSLFLALTALRHPTLYKSFWIDGLCINQNDLRERAEQVKIMHFIFNRSSVVQAWLGNTPFKIHDLIHDMNREDSMISSWTKESPVGRLGSKKDDQVQETVDRLVELARLDYWGRLWILQELALAPRVRFVSNYNSFSWESFDSAYELMQEWRRLGIVDNAYELECVQNGLGPVLAAWRLFSTTATNTLEEDATILTELLSRARLSECSDPRDRIYGLLGIILTKFGSNFVEVNYESSVADVYMHFAGSLITKTGSLPILNQTDNLSNSVVGLPTWVPDWTSQSHQRDAMYRCGQKYHERFQAAGAHSFGYKKLAPTYFPSRVLPWKGHIFGIVQKIGTYAPSGWAWSQDSYLPPVLASWRKLYRGTEAQFCRTITSNAPDMPRSLKEYDDLLMKKSARRDEKHFKIWKVLLSTISHRRFLITESGIPGLGPRDTRQGDVIAILAGGRVPYVLRRSPNQMKQSLNLYSFVGECYVDGVMYGEIMERPNPPPFDEIWLE